MCKRGCLRDYERDAGAPVRMVGTPVLAGDEALPRRAAPALGADTEAVLREAGFSGEAIRGLRAKRVV